jgi:uncharacterized DUF497 family protein
MTVRFEWDETKNRVNIAKHGVGLVQTGEIGNKTDRGVKLQRLKT